MLSLALQEYIFLLRTQKMKYLNVIYFSNFNICSNIANYFSYSKRIGTHFPCSSGQAFSSVPVKKKTVLKDADSEENPAEDWQQSQQIHAV